jgi:hypothetical protein
MRQKIGRSPGRDRIGNVASGLRGVSSLQHSPHSAVPDSGALMRRGVRVTIFGGFAPFLATWRVARTGDVFAPGYYVVAAAILNLVALLSIREQA